MKRYQEKLLASAGLGMLSLAMFEILFRMNGTSLVDVYSWSDVLGAIWAIAGCVIFGVALLSALLAIGILLETLVMAI